MGLTTAQERALETLQTFDERKVLYKAANDAIKATNQDFPSLINMIDPAIETSIVKVLDAVLGDEIASYYINEIQFMNDGGSITENGKTWRIKTVDDVRAYVVSRAARLQQELDAMNDNHRVMARQMADLGRALIKAEQERDEAYERLSIAANYFNRYCQDEAAEPELCVSDQHHEDAKAFEECIRRLAGPEKEGK